MDIKRAGSTPSGKGPADWFTGQVRIDPLFDTAAPARAAGANVTFEPGARTAWHTHPLGQTIIVTSGLGWAQKDGGPVEEVFHATFVTNEPETLVDQQPCNRAIGHDCVLRGPRGPIDSMRSGGQSRHGSGGKSRRGNLVDLTGIEPVTS